MAGFDQYQAIPGHNAQFKDGNLNLKNDPNPPSTESILFLGTATDGPLNQPVSVNPDTVNLIFGKVSTDNGVPNGATLIPAFEEAWQAGNRDIRLMRVSGETSFSSLAGTTYSIAKEEVTDEIIGTGLGNEADLIELPHGGIDVSSLVVQANGVILPNTAYSATAGVALSEDPDNLVTEEKAELTLNANVTDMEAEILVSYTYTYTDEEGTVQSVSVSENNTDANGDPIIAHGKDVEYTLKNVAKSGARLYVRGSELTNPTDAPIFTIVGNVITIKPTKKIKLGDKLELSYAYTDTVVVEPEIKLESVYGGSLYNDIKREVKTVDGVTTITITKPESKRSIMSELPLVFTSSDFPTYQLLVNAINTHPNNNVVKASTETPDLLVTTLQDSAETSFTGGKDELNLSNEEMYKRLGGEVDDEGYVTRQGAYTLLENYLVDFVYPLGVHADDKLVGKYDNFAYQLALACAVMSHYNNVTIGLINTTTPSDTSLAGIENHVRKLEALENLYYMRDTTGEIITDGEGNRFDLGQFIEVIAGPDFVVPNTRLGQIVADSSAAYVGMVSDLPVQSAPTNKALPSVAGLRFQYSANQLNRLTQNRFTTFRYKTDGRVGVVDAMTAAHVGSDYTRLSTARIVKEAVNAVREVADPFIGEPNDAANRNALTSAVDKRLSKMIEAKALLGFQFRLVVTQQMELIGEGQIELSLQAPNELRRLTTIVSLSV